jgi:hypothetical protein
LKREAKPLLLQFKGVSNFLASFNQLEWWGKWRRIGKAGSGLGMQMASSPRQAPWDLGPFPRAVLLLRISFNFFKYSLCFDYVNLNN